MTVISEFGSTSAMTWGTTAILLEEKIPEREDRRTQSPTPGKSSNPRISQTVERRKDLRRPWDWELQTHLLGREAPAGVWAKPVSVLSFLCLWLGKVGQHFSAS